MFGSTSVEIETSQIQDMQKFLRSVVTGQGRDRRTGRFTSNRQVDVGFSARYAIYVHEDLNANHPNGGSAKFLEIPARELKQEIRMIINTTMQSGLGVELALIRAGRRLMRAAQELTPVKTGHLRDSGFVRLRTGDR